MINARRGKVIGLGLVPLVLGLCGTAQAQEPPAPPSAPAEAAHAEEEIVVTATKREQRLRDIPASIDAFQGDELETLGQLGVADFIERSAGVTISAGAPTIQRVSIRGIGTDTSPGGDIPPTTGVFIGDVAFTDPYLAGIQPDLSAFDLASVEILKGPQGTLFGGSALAGAVRYVLQEPEMGEWQVRGFSQLASPDSGSQAWTNGVVVNVPLAGESLALRLGYVNREYPGLTDITRTPRRKDVDASEGEQIRGILTWRPSAASELTLTHLSQDFAADDATYFSSLPDRHETDRVVVEQPAGSEFVLDSLEAGYDFGDMRLVSITSQTTKHLNALVDVTAGFNFTPDGYPPELAFVTTIDNDSEAWAQELRLQSMGDEGLQWLVGAYWYQHDYSLDLLIDTAAHIAGDNVLHESLLTSVGFGPFLALVPPDATMISSAVGRTRTTERALFFDLSQTFWDRLEVSLGARFYQTQVEGGFTGDGLLVRAINFGMPFDARDNQLEEEGVSPKFAVLYRFAPNLSAYASASRGFRFGGVNSTPTTLSTTVPRLYESDSLWNYELGLRSSLFDNALQFDITGFYIDYENPLLAQRTQDALQLAYFDNVGAAVSQGVEISARWRTPIDGLVLDLDAALTDAHITEPFIAADGTLVPSGAQMPGAAETQYSATMSYAAPLGPMNLGASLNYTYIGEGYNDIVHSFAINDYGTLNAGVSLGDDAWTLSFNATNILDEITPKGGAMVSTFSYGRVPQYVLSQPRTLTLRLGVEF